MVRLSKKAGVLCLAGLLLITAFESSAQFYNRGEDPGSLKWEQIRTEHFRVIHPVDFRPEARRAAHLLESYYEPNASYLGHRPSPIPVVLHNRSVLSNGFVAWAPKRMEMVTTPYAKSYSQDYMEQLVLHEFRHVVQVDKLNQGFTKGFSILIGQAGTGGVAGFIPFWFLEGDATDAETRLSHAGRGRLPSFEMEIKAILADRDGLYPYEKAVFGSFRDHIPNHYQYGYQMVSHARNKYGNLLWDEVLTYTARRPYTLYPFYFGLRKYAGLSKTDLYRETFGTLRSYWSEQAAGRLVSDASRINLRGSKHYTSYRFPRYINDSLIFAEKTGIDQIPEFVSIDPTGKEKRIHRPGLNDAANISVANGKIVWTEIIQDLRWARRSFSVIKVYDLKTHSERILSMRTRYFAPDLSSDGKWIAAVDADEQNHYSLVILSERTGEVAGKIASPSNEYLQYPAWDEKRNRICMTSLGESGKKIVSYGLDSGEWLTLFDAGFEDVAELFCRGDYLVFRGAFSGIDNIYALNLESLEYQRITSSRMGAFTPGLSANGDTLIYADYTSQGYDVVKILFRPPEFIPLDESRDHSEQLNQPTEEEESRVPIPGPATESYPSRKYRKAGNLFNFHSWAPFYVDIHDPSIENLEASPGVMLLSQNLLSTATTILGYEYNLKRRDHFLHASFTYTGWFPAFELSLDYGGLPYIASPPDTSRAIPDVQTDLSLKTEVFLPLNLTYNRYIMGMQPSVEASYSRAYFFYDEPGEYRSGLTFMDYRLYFYSYLRKGMRDILPRLGMALDLRYVDTPFEKEQLGSQVFGSGTLYLPGLLRHQTLKVFAGAQQQDPENFLMGNLMSMPRGVYNHTATQLQKLTFDYVFPIAYPDLRIWHAAYFKRFRGSVFYDYAYGRGVYIHGESGGSVNRSFQSLGLELTTDVHLIQIFLPFNIGARVALVPETGAISGDFIFSIDMSGL